MTTPQTKEDAGASDIAQHASNFIKSATETTSLSALQLASVFKIAAASCDEFHSIYERAQMAIKLRGWSPGK